MSYWEAMCKGGACALNVIALTTTEMLDIISSRAFGLQSAYHMCLYLSVNVGLTVYIPMDPINSYITLSLYWS